ncbi:MAG TPA: tetratricopeptide repeat protein [Nitrospira sp.]|nr:tetratricopeptide repeat protein [Nitrospira sp.]
MAGRRLLILSSFIFLASVTGCEDRRADKAYVRGDYDKAAADIQFLAKRGEPRAQYDLAVMYDQGQGVAQSDAEAMRWYELAAEQGEPRAQYNLGLMYLNGQGVPPDLAKAYSWISLAASQGNAHALDAKDYVSEKMSAAQMAEAKRLVEEYHSRAAQRKGCTFCNTSYPSY